MMTKTRMLAIEVTLKHAEDALAVGRILNLDDPAELRERIATAQARLDEVETLLAADEPEPGPDADHVRPLGVEAAA